MAKCSVDASSMESGKAGFYSQPPNTIHGAFVDHRPSESEGPVAIPNVPQEDDGTSCVSVREVLGKQSSQSNVGAPHEMRSHADAAPIDQRQGDDAQGMAAQGLYGEGAAWGLRDFLSRSFLAPLSIFTLLWSFLAPFLAMAQGQDSMVAWMPFAMSVSLGNVLLFFGIFWCHLCLIKGDKHYFGVWCGNVFTSVTGGAEIILRRNLPMIYIIASGMLLMILICCFPGTRSKFATRSIIGLLCLFEIPLYGVRRFLPPLLCTADAISPLVTSFVYPMITAVYEGLYLPLVFYMWSFKSRQRIPELALYFQLTLIMASSEALFYGGLIQMVSRYPEAMLPRYVGVSIMSRCFGKLLDRCGFWHWVSSRLFSNEMHASRDLIGRHSNAQYVYGAIIVLMMSASGLMMQVVESIHGTHFQTVYSRPILWFVMFSSVAMGMATEMCIAALSWWHRREIPNSGTYAENFLMLHLPGRQPYFTSLRNLLGKPANRRFERKIRPREITDTLRPVMMISPQNVVLLTSVALCFAIGPSAQTLGFINSPDSASCN